MSVPENSRTKSKLEVCVKAHDLCCYTLQITANKKIFTEEYQKSLTDRIVAVAIGRTKETVSACKTVKTWKIAEIKS